MDFQPFSVTCVTCSSRLRVSRPELVGSIVSCPKCQSMVQLAPPKTDPAGAAPIAVGTHLVDSDALTEDSISQADGPDSEAPPVLPAGGFAEPPPVVSSDPTRSQPSPDTAASAEPTASQPVAPPPDWHSQKNARSRRIAMLVAVVLASVVSASVLFAVIRRSRSGSAQTQTPDAAVAEAEAEVEAEASPPQPTPDPAPSADDTDAGRIDGEAVVDATAEASAVSVDDEPPAHSRDGASKLAPVDNPPSNENAGPPSDLLTDSPLLSASPLDGMTPLPTAPLQTPPLGDAPDPTDETGTLTELPKELQGLLNGLGGIGRPQFTETQPAPETIDEIQLDRATEVDVDLEVALDPRDEANMRQALGLTVAMQTSDPNGYPLNDLMLLLSQLSGVPIEVEWVSFDIVGIPINSRVPLPKGWPTVEDILTAVCVATDCTFDKKARTITLRPTDEKFNQAVAELLDLSDLAPESDSAVSVARALLGQTEGDPSRVTIPTEGGPAQLAVFVCEAIRRARGATGKLPDAIFARWGGTYEDQVNAWPKLQAGVSGSPRIQAATVAALVRQIAKLNGATCYVNWQDAARRDLKPTDKRMPRTGEGVSAADAMKQLLEPEDMLARVVDAEHWWIGSDASLDRFPVVIWFDDDAAAEETQQRVGMVLQGAAVNEQIIGAVAVDPKSQKCVAVLPRFLLRQLPRMLDNAL
ncbi:hypothetical protein NZK35_31090 [Stieleria sp. ICT_E10.1]|uniref:hypothetical protein n=1 Tax=Stieleria sedimenti TaxID=2976331 RepID=UPI00218033F7|nr:hypothetical protein [Stieleria sedimenti]MCS7471125.1 hypothetical protein [Stieleria sedimenti]